MLGIKNSDRRLFSTQRLSLLQGVSHLSSSPSRVLLLYHTFLGPATAERSFGSRGFRRRSRYRDRQYLEGRSKNHSSKILAETLQCWFNIIRAQNLRKFECTGWNLRMVIRLDWLWFWYSTHLVQLISPFCQTLISPSTIWQAVE